MMANPDPPPQPEPPYQPPVDRQARVLMYLPVGSPPFIVRPSAGEVEPMVKIVKTPEDHFERLWELLPIE